MTNNTSLYIPHIFANISEERIRSVIENAAKYGQVEQIDLVPKKSADGKAYNSAYIHMKNWNQDEKTQKFLAHLKDTTKQTHIVYDKPWYWIVLENTSSEKKKNKKALDMNEFPPLKTQATAAQMPNADDIQTPPRPNRELSLLGAPTRKPKAVTTAGAVHKELDYDDDNMNLVDADYVYHMEQENTQLRNETEWLQDENCAMKQEIDRLRAMMMGMMGGMGM